MDESVWRGKTYSGGWVGGDLGTSLAGHTNTLAIVTDISGEVKRRFLPAKAEVSSPRS